MERHRRLSDQLDVVGAPRRAERLWRGRRVIGAWAETTPAAGFTVQAVVPSCKVNGAFLTFAFY